MSRRTTPIIPSIEMDDNVAPAYHSPSSSVSSLSGSDVVFSQPALAASRDNDLAADHDTDDESYSDNVFAWPTVESPAAHHSSPLRPAHRALLLAGSGEAPPPRSVHSAASASLVQSTHPTASDRRRHALSIALGREAEQAMDPSTSLARRIAARESARTSSSQQDPFFPTARLLSRTTISVAEPDPPADLRRLATTREAERQLHYRDWHRLGLLDPSTVVAGSDGAGVSPGRLTPPLTYARRRSSAATTRTFTSHLEANNEEDEDMDVLSMDITQRLRRRLATLDALDPITDSQLEREREHDPSAPLPSLSSSIRTIDRRLARTRPWLGLGAGRTSALPEWELDGRNDPNGELVYNEHLATPAGRSRYWNALSNAATDDLLALAAEMLALLTRISTAERMNRLPPSLPPGLTAPVDMSGSPVVPTNLFNDPLPSPLGTMLRPTSRQRFIAAFHAS